MGKLLFHAYFKELLKSRNTSTYALWKSGKVKVDKALIYKWRSGNKVPALASPYREQIAQALELTTKERELLKQAQINSLEAKRQQGNVPEANNDAAEVMEYFSSGRSQNVPRLLPSSSHAESEKAPRGRQAVISAAINLLRNLPPPEIGEKSPQILLSLQGSDALALQEPLNAGLYAALCAGWSVSHCLRLEENNRQSVRLIKFISNLLGTGRYHVWYFKRDGKLSPLYDVLIVPTRGALIFFAADNADYIDSAIFVDDPEQVKILQDHFHQLTDKKEPLMQAYLPDQRRSYWEVLEEGELQAGGRFTVRTGLTGLTRPRDWFTEESSWMMKKYRTKDIAWLAAHYQRRMQAFINNLEADYVFRDIYLKHGIVQFVKTGNYSQHLPGGPISASPQERRDHLQNIIDLLNRYPNYEIALVDKDKEQAIVPLPFWEVTGKLRVLIATICTDEKEIPIKVDLVIREPTVVEVFSKHFESIWNQIDASNKDKEPVIAFLQEQIAQLEGR